MPAILADFGLKEAIRDICRKLAGSVRFKCIVTGIPGKLDKHLEMVIYRIVQELMLNVVKHAQASTATAIIAGTKKKISITMQDDGAGFESSVIHPGIGLQTINSSVHLFNGTMEVSTKPGKGTYVNIQLPLSLPASY